MLRRVLVTLGLGGLLVLLGWWTLHTLAASKREPERSERIERPVAVRVRTAHRTAYRERLVGYGRARSLKAARVAAEVAGVVVWVSPRLESGTLVEQGEELLRLEDEDLRLELESANARLARNEAQKRRLEADLRSTERQLEVARRELEASLRELERIRALSGSAAVTESDLDRQSMETALREAAVVRLEGNRDSFEAQIATTAAEAREIEATRLRALLDLERTKVKAPFAGRIEARLVDAGERVAVGTGLFDLLDPSALEIPVALGASAYGHVGVGSKATVHFGGESAAYTVARVAPVVRSADRTFDVFLVPVPPVTFPPGAFVTAELEGRLFEDVFVIPREAVVSGRVFVAEQGVARLRTPKVRALLPAVLLADGGLEEGDALILTNLEELVDGMRVTPAPEEP